MRKLAKLAAVIVLGCSGMSSAVNAMDDQDIRSQINDLRSTIDDLNKQISELNEQNKELLQYCASIEEERIIDWLSEVDTDKGSAASNFYNWLKSYGGCMPFEYEVKDLKDNVMPFIARLRETRVPQIIADRLFGGFFKIISDTVDAAQNSETIIWPRDKRVVIGIIKYVYDERIRPRRQVPKTSKKV